MQTLELITKRTKFKVYKIVAIVRQVSENALLLETEFENKKYVTWIPMQILIPSKKKEMVFNLADWYEPTPNTEISNFLSLAKEQNRG
jgi:hypothetical protein